MCMITELNHIRYLLSLLTSSGKCSISNTNIFWDAAERNAVVEKQSENS